jgi:hypothetical protein
MYLIVIIIGLFFQCDVVRSLKWHAENIEQSIKSRDCLHEIYLKQVDDLFYYLNDIETRQELEAILFDRFAHQLRLGIPFCQILVTTVRMVRDILEHKINRMLHKQATKNDFMANGWLATIAYFDSPGRMERCQRELRNISSIDDPKINLSIFSETVRCFNSNRKLTTMRTMVARFKHEEDATEMINK